MWYVIFLFLNIFFCLVHLEHNLYFVYDKEEGEEAQAQTEPADMLIIFVLSFMFILAEAFFVLFLFLFVLSPTPGGQLPVTDIIGIIIKRKEREEEAEETTAISIGIGFANGLFEFDKGATAPISITNNCFEKEERERQWGFEFDAAVVTVAVVSTGIDIDSGCDNRYEYDSGAPASTITTNNCFEREEGYGFEFGATAPVVAIGCDNGLFKCEFGNLEIQVVIVQIQ